jgi:hypothetical protein
MRAEALRDLLVGTWSSIRRLALAAAGSVRAWRRRRGWNLSVPAPHR